MVEILKSTSNNANDTNPDPSAAVEQTCSEIVALVRSCIDCIRRAMQRQQQPPVKTAQQQDTAKIIYTELCDNDVCLERIDVACRHIRALLPCNDNDNDDDGNSDNDANDHRRLFLCNILWPLLRALAQSYELLDASLSLPRPIPAPVPRQRRARSQPLPPPPPGLLSLQDYTNVAILLELLVCVSVLPNLDDQVLRPASQRVQPQAVAGRLPPAAFVGWQLPHHHNNDTPRFYELSRTCMILTRVLRLDRFRPMLLPRHLPDIVASLWQAQALEQPQRELPHHYSLQNIAAQLKQYPVDTTLWARTYQILLPSGAAPAAPFWLKQRASIQLSQLASTTPHGLSAVVQVFTTNHDGSSVLRLARALTVQRSSAELQQLLGHAAQLLDNVLIREGAEAATTADGSNKLATTITLDQLQSMGLTSQQAIHVQLYWAIADQVVSTHAILPSLFTHPASNRGHARGDDVPLLSTFIRRVGVLFTLVPPFIKLDTLFRLLLKPLNDGHVRVGNAPIGNNDVQLHGLSLLLHVAATESVLQSDIKDDAISALRLVCLSTATKQHVDDSAAAGDVLAAAMVQAMAPSQVDRAGYVYEVSETDVALVRKTNAMVLSSDIAVKDTLSLVEARATCLARRVLGSLERDEDSSDNEGSLGATTMLGQRIFDILVSIYISGCGGHAAESTAQNTACRYQLVAMTALPIFGDCWGPYLMTGTSRIGHDSGLFATMRLVLIHLARSMITEEEEEEFSTSLTTTTDPHSTMAAAFDFLDTFCGTDKCTDSMPCIEDWSLLLTIGQLILGILVGVLEFGSAELDRNGTDRFDALVPALHVIATGQLPVASDDCDDPDALVQLTSTATHALALIASSKPNSARAAESFSDSHAVLGVNDLIHAARSDLSSPDPPMRARGIVRLRHVLALLKDDVPTEPGTQASGWTSTEGGNDHLEQWQVAFSLAVEALADTESYVYLAAIHCVAGLGATRPREATLLLTRAVATGSFASANFALSLEQRLKLAEALTIVVRRRATVNDTIGDVLDIILHVTPAANSRLQKKVSLQDGVAMQHQTHAYFSGDRKETNEANRSKDERLADQELRLNTGGPLFWSEEADALVASKLQIMAEIVTAARPPAVLAPYCSALFQAALFALQLHAARTIRRAGALLAREIYKAVCREQDACELHAEKSGGRQQAFAFDFTLAVVRANETALHASLERCVKGEDLVDLTHRGQFIRLHDTAVVARAEEALHLRQEVKGALLRARVMVGRQPDAAEAAIHRMLRRNDGPSVNLCIAKHV